MQILVTVEAQRQIGRLPRAVRARVLKLIERLRRWPDVSGVKPMGPLAGRYRMRTGDYRLQFYLQGESLIVEKIGHRDGFYEE